MIVKYPDKLKKKISKMKQDGASNLHIVSDFDRTLTKASVKGIKHQSSYAKIRNAGYMDEEYTLRGNMLAKHYYPLEIDASLSSEEKSRYMQDWWEKHSELLIRYGFTSEMARRVVLDFGIDFRDGALEFFEKLDDNDIPLLILSAGLGDVINEIIKISSLDRENVCIISNFFEFNSEGVAIDYKRPLIHPFNKNEVAVKDTPYHKQIENRKNVILLGDNIGDLGMSEGLDHDCIIKIGFLNDNSDKLLDDFKENFDVVITGDGPMFDALDILSQILD